MFMPRKHRRPKDGTRSAQKVGLVRYRKDQWDRWLEMVDDRKAWESTHEEWQHKAEAMAGRLQRAGLEVVWVDVDPDQIALWCKSRGYKNDGEARSLFAAEWIGNISPPGAKIS